MTTLNGFNLFHCWLVNMTTSSVKMLGLKNAFGQAIEKKKNCAIYLSDDINVLQNRNGVNEPNNIQSCNTLGFFLLIF